MKTEATEFFALLARVGWNQSEAARRLRLSTGVISQYKSGKTAPSRRTMAFLRHLVSEALYGAGAAHEAEAGGMVLREDARVAARQLSEMLNENAPGATELRELIQTNYTASRKRNPKVSSDKLPPSRQREIEAMAEAETLEEIRTRGATAGSTSRIIEPRPTARGESGEQRSGAAGGQRKNLDVSSGKK